MPFSIVKNFFVMGKFVLVSTFMGLLGFVQNENELELIF